MRTCRDYEALISEWIDGRLPETERAELMGHMALCPVCQRYFDDQIAIHEALMDLEEVPAPADLSARIMERVRQTAQETGPETLRWADREMGPETLRETDRKMGPETLRKTGRESSGRRGKGLRMPAWRRWAAVAACCAVAAAGLWSLRPSPAAQNQTAPRMAAYGGEDLPAAEGIAPQSDQPAGRSGAAPVPAEEEPGAAPVPAEETPAAAPEEKAAQDSAPAPMPALTAPKASDSGAGADTAAGPWAGKLTTASPVAAAWVEEHLGLEWTGGGLYELTAEEYRELRSALEEAGEDFSETSGQPEAAIYLLAAAQTVS